MTRPADTPAPREAGATANQCDGCRRGLPVVSGLHYEDGHPVIGCTADRYEALGTINSSSTDSSLIDRDGAGGPP